jgi:hypothetical protein
MTPIPIETARHFAPPLFVVDTFDRRGAKLRCVNRRAVDYALNAGFGVEDIYPGGLGKIRSLAPVWGSPEAPAFVSATGLTTRDVYPPRWTGSKPARRRRWGWLVAGLILGAAFGGPIGAITGGLLLEASR